MYQWFRVKNYRNFDDLKLDGFKQVNLIAGMNNVGKSNLLEALFIHSGAYNPNLLMVIRALRGFDRLKIDLSGWAESPLTVWFHRKNTEADIVLEGHDQATGQREIILSLVHDPSEIPQVPASEITDESGNGSSRPVVASSSDIVQAIKLESRANDVVRTHYLVLTVKGVQVIPFAPPPPFQTFYTTTRGTSDPNPELYTNLVKKNRESAVFDILKLVEPNLQDVFLLTEADQTRLWGRLDFGPIPLLDMGQGVVHLANLVIRIANASGGVLLIDEIDNGLHYSVLLQIWRFIGRLAREFNTQVFATTHSRECIRAAHEAFSANEELHDFRLYRLQRTPDNRIDAVKYDQDTLGIALETGLEVR